MMANSEGRELLVIELGTVPYGEALALQRRLVAAKKAGALEPDLLLLLEHPPVITLGRRGDEGNILASPALLAERGIEVHHVERGGDVTYHGPGQLVGYPIIDLKRVPNRKDVGKFVWVIQEAIIRTLRGYAIPAERIEKVIGVWVRRPAPDLSALTCDPATRAGLERAVAAYDDRKIAAIGARVEGWITFHGFALNVNTDLNDFNLIVPCGLQERGVTSMQVELGRAVPLAEVGRAIARHLSDQWGHAARRVGREAFLQEYGAPGVGSEHKQRAPLPH